MINTKVSEKLGKDGVMTIKIIRHGILRECECFNCGCIFSFEKEDVKKELIHISKYVTYVECPECEERNIISL